MNSSVFDSQNSIRRPSDRNRLEPLGTFRRLQRRLIGRQFKANNLGRCFVTNFVTQNILSYPNGVTLAFYSNLGERAIKSNESFILKLALMG